MKPTISLITIAVADLERALVFYRDGLGLQTEGIFGEEFEDGAVVFFHMNPGLILALWPRSSLAKDANVPVDGPAVTEFSLAHNVNSRDEVDTLMRQAAAAGAHVTTPAHDTFYGGYAGYFQDPDGHLWEIAWNPNLTLPT
jgi:uncharacterized glyoxalase superfamily protein PhnB